MNERFLYLGARDEGMSLGSTNSNSNLTNNQETDEDKLEKLHIRKVVEAFLFYKEFSFRRVDRLASNFDQLPYHHRKMLPDFTRHLKEVKRCICVNQEFLQNIVSCTDGMFENRDMELKVSDKEALQGSSPITGFDMDKITTTLKQFVRDWSEEGKIERDACYTPIIDEIKRLFPSSENNKNVSVLVPGAGLGRLMFEIARLGYDCQGNEWSLYMLFASHYVLNRSSGFNDSVIHPYVSQWCNVQASADQVRPIRIPDVDPHDIKPGTQFSMAAGNFLEVYTENDQWDCITTCFFIDTAHNIIKYIEQIWNILKPGGYWINLGPLLYHFSGMPNEVSIDLSYEDVKRIITENFRFELLKEQTKVSSGYVENCRSMLKMNYESVFFVVRKPW